MRCGMHFKSEMLLKGGSHSAGPYVYAIHFKNSLLKDLLGMCCKQTCIHQHNPEMCVGNSMSWYKSGVYQMRSLSHGFVDKTF